MTSRQVTQAPSSSDMSAGDDAPGIQARQHGTEATPSFRMNITSIKQPLAPQLSMPDVPRPPLRSRSTDGLTVSSATHDVDATTATRVSYDGRGGTAGNEFVVADVPSPVLMNPSQGLNGLSEALAHLVTENAARSHVTASPAMSRQASNEVDGVYAPSAISAAIASATRPAYRASGVRTTGPSTRQASSDMTTNHSSPPTAMTSISSRSPSDGMHGKNTSGGATKTAGFASGKSSRAASGARTPTAFAMLRRGSNDASRSNSPGSSGKSTPLFTFASGARTKPKVLETNRLQLNTHTPSGRRMINHYIIEDELGRGVHGKVRLARDTDTGERVAVKIVEREGKKRLGGGPNWAVRAAAASKSSSKEVSLRRQSSNEDEAGESSSMAVDQDKSGDVDNDDSAHAAQQQTRFASPPSSPSVSARAGDVSSAARQGRRGEGMFAGREVEKEREKARKRLLWTTDQKVKREIALMKKCAHENVVRLREVIDDPQSKKIFMVLEFMEGGEVRWKDDRGFPTLTVDQARRTLRDVVLGLEYLHYQGIIHRDIKPANLLWDKEHRLVKISDFGVSHFSYALLVASGGLPSLDSDEERQRDPSLADDRELAKTAGSPAFFAPELCMAGEPVPTAHSVASGNSLFKRGTEFPWTENGAADESARPVANKESIKRTRPPITKAIDVWALGVTLYCLLFGHVPFTADSEYALFNVIMKEDYSLPHYMGADRVRIGLRKKRWMYQQPWTDEEGDVDEDDAHSNEPDIKPALLGDEALMVRDLLDRLLEKDPSRRISLEEVKKHPWLTRGLTDPPLWLRKTDPAHLPYVEVTNEDVETALTGFSKFKQTIKRFQHKFFSTLSGAHTPVTEHSPPARDSTQSHSKGGTATMAGQPLHRRRRSKSASQASREAVMSSIEAKAPHLVSAAKSKAPSPPVALSGRPHLFFSRRRSTALEGDDGKNPLGLAAMAAGMSVSQPNSRPHSPMGSKERLTEQKPMLLPPRHADGASHSTPMASLTPIVSGEVATDQHDSLSASMARLGARPPKAGQNRMRPSSRGSLRTLEAFHFLHDPRRGTEGDATAADAASSGSRPRRATVSPSTSVRDGSRTATEQPARTRSRPRLGEVFRNVWHGGSHNGHADDGTSSRSFRFRSRPITAASSSSVSPSLEKSVAAALPAQRSTGDGGIPSAAARAVRADSEPPTQQPEPPEQAGGDAAHVIDVDDYDVDLDLSDDDSDVEQRRSSVQPHRVLRGTSTGGWAVESMSRQQSSVGGGGSHESGGHTTGEESHQSATPSVEGGYNLYKPPFVGRFQFTDPFAPPGGATGVAEAEAPHSVTLELADSSEAAALRRGSEVAVDDEDEGDGGSGEEVHHVTLPVRTHAAAISTGADANAALDTSVDRFADADELSEEEQHREGAAQDHDYDDDDDDDDDDEDDCVSFQAGRRQPAH